MTIMRKNCIYLVASGLLAAALFSGCETISQTEMDYATAWGSINAAVCVVTPTEGNSCRGLVRFYQTGEFLKVVADLEGLAPNQDHGFHVHEFGDCTAPDGSSAGEHYNPEGYNHGLPDELYRHAGDLGNVTADGDGKAHYEKTVSNISVAGVRNPIIGRGLIIHAQPDDGQNPAGNAGARVGCGVIGIAGQ